MGGGEEWERSHLVSGTVFALCYEQHIGLRFGMMTSQTNLFFIGWGGVMGNCLIGLIHMKPCSVVKRCYQACSPKSDQFEISPAASPEIRHSA